MYVYALTMLLVIVGRIYAFLSIDCRIRGIKCRICRSARSISWLNFGIFVCTSSVRPSKALSETL
jgi:hypothetical protein